MVSHFQNYQNYLVNPQVILLLLSQLYICTKDILEWGKKFSQAQKREFGSKNSWDLRDKILERGKLYRCEPKNLCTNSPQIMSQFLRCTCTGKDFKKLRRRAAPKEPDTDFSSCIVLRRCGRVVRVQVLQSGGVLVNIPDFSCKI